MPAIKIPANPDDLSQEITPPQILLRWLPVDNYTLPKTRRQSKAWYKKIRAMRDDPTISIARAMSVAPVLTGDWSVETKPDAPEGAQELISEMFIPMRDSIMESALKGTGDFGWIGYEKVIEYKNGANVLTKLKPLLQDDTDIMIFPDTGTFAGLTYYDGRGNYYYLPPEKSLMLNYDSEAGEMYGNGMMQVAESPYDKWLQTDDGAQRYDRKMAGAHWIVGFPLGESELNGELKCNSIIADQIAQFLQASGTVCIPTTLTAMVDDLNTKTKAGDSYWYVRLESDSGGQTNFIEREKYLDALKARAFCLPERSIFEGQFGTKAEADAHSDFALMIMEMRSRGIVRQVNWHAVNQILRLNYGDDAENTVYIRAMPIADEDRAFYRTLYATLLSSSQGAQLESLIDTEALSEKLGVPILPLSDIDAPGAHDKQEGGTDGDEDTDLNDNPDFDPEISDTGV